MVKKILPMKNDKQIARKKVLKSMTVRTVKKVSLHICLEFSKIVKVIFHLRKSLVNNNKQMSSIQMRIWQVKILLLLRNTKVQTKVTSKLRIRLGFKQDKKVSASFF